MGIIRSHAWGGLAIRTNLTRLISKICRETNSTLVWTVEIWLLLLHTISTNHVAGGGYKCAVVNKLLLIIIGLLLTANTNLANSIKLHKSLQFCDSLILSVSMSIYTFSCVQSLVFHDASKTTILADVSQVFFSPNLSTPADTNFPLLN
jgi:hypothetical protein